MSVRKTRVFRVVTSNYCIPAHLDNTLKRIPQDYELYVLGDKVTDYAKNYTTVKFINVPLKRTFSFFYDPVSFVILLYHLINKRPHIVHSLMTKAGLFSALAAYITFRPKRLHTFTGQIWANDTGLKRYFLILIDKFICTLNTMCLTDSPSQSRFLFDNGVKFKGTEVPCLLKGSLSGVDVDKMNSPSVIQHSKQIMSELGLKETDYIIGYIARKSIDKGCMDMLNIFLKLHQKNKKIKLLFIGPDESNGKIEAFLNSNSEIRDQIIQLGFVHNHESYLKICKILCLPSHREGFGSIIIDAASLGIPTVGYSIPGLVDSIFDRYSGFLVGAGDQESFVEKLELLMNDERLYAELSENAKKVTVEFFSADRLNEALYKVYDK